MTALKAVFDSVARCIRRVKPTPRMPQKGKGPFRRFSPLFRRPQPERGMLQLYRGVWSIPG